LVNWNLGSSENLKEREHLEKLVMYGIKCTLQKLDRNVWTGII